jgi:hypothetical protein
LIDHYLHAAGGVNKHNISVLFTGMLDSGLRNLRLEEEFIRLE